MGVLLGSCVTFLAFNTNEKQGKDQKALLSHLPKNNFESTDEIAKLRDENAQLKMQIKHAQPGEAPAQKLSNSQSSPTINDTNTCDARIQYLMAFFAEKDKLIAEAKDIKSTSSYDEKLHNDFNSEDKDEKWSSTIESKFLKIFSANESSRDFVVSSISCRSSTCEVKVPVANIEAKNRIMEIVSNPAVAKGLGFDNSSVKSSLQILGGEMTLYISNKN